MALNTKKNVLKQDFSKKIGKQKRNQRDIFTKYLAECNLFLLFNMDGVIVEGVDDGKGLDAGETLGGKKY